MTAPSLLITDMRSAGFTDQEIGAITVPLAEEMRSVGFSEQEIIDGFGLQSVPAFDPAPLTAHFDKAIGEAREENGGDLSFLEAVNAGFQQSIIGLAKRQALPSVTVPEDASAVDRVTAQVTAVALDLPFFAIGGALAAPSGGGILSPVTATAGAFALPAAIREVLIRTYRDGKIASFSQFWDVFSGALTEAGKGAVVGAAVGISGPLAGAAVRPIAAGAEVGAALSGSAAVRSVAPFVKPVVISVAEKAALVTSLAGVGSAFEGRVPEARDFTDAAAVIGVLVLGGRATAAGGKQIAKGVRSLQKLYVNTGRTPKEVAIDSLADPTISNDLVSKNLNETPRAYVELKEGTKQEIVSAIDSKADVEAMRVIRDVEVKREPKEVETEPDSPLAKVKSRISFEGGKKKRRTITQTFDSLYADWVRALHPMQKFVKAVSEGQELSIVNDPAKLSQLEPGITARAGHFLTFSPIEFGTFKRVGKPLNKILEPVKAEMEDFAAFLVARVTVEREANRARSKKVANGKQEESLTGIDVKTAKAAIIEGKKRFETAANELVEFQTFPIAYLRDAGVLSKESFDFMVAANKQFVPLNRVLTEDAGITRTAGVGKKVRNPVFRFKGSELEIVNPLESIVKNTYMFIALAERNQIGLQLVKLAESSGRADIAKRVDAPAKPIKLDSKELARATKKWAEGKELTESETAVLEAFAESSMTIFRKDALQPKDNQIVVFDKGVRSVWEIDSEVFRVFRDGSRETNNIVFKALEAMTRTIRGGIILAPEFSIRNLGIDTFEAFIFSENGLRFFTDSMRGAASVIRKDSVFQDWLISGGPQASLVSLDRTYLQKGIRDIFDKQGLGNRIHNVVRSPLEVLRLLTEFTDSASRVGEFKRATEGKARTKENILQAGLDSRNVSLDFAQMGSQAREVNKFVTFFAVSINGADRAIRGIAKNPKRTMARITQSIVIPSLVLYLHNRDKQWYKDLPEWVRDTTWPVMLNGVIYKIRKPMEIGVMFGTGTERMAEFVLSKDPEAFDGFFAAMLEAGTPGLIPQVAITPVEQFANKRTFFNTPIVPAPLEGLLPEYRYVQYTTELSKAVGRLIASIPALKQSKFAAPLRIEAAVQTTTGALGRHVLNLADFTLRKAGVLDDPPRPSVRFSELPFVKSFVVRNPSLSAAPIQEFFKRFEERKVVIDTINKLSKAGDIEAAQRETRIAGGKPVNLLDIRKAIGNSMKMIRAYNNPRMPGTPDEKRQIVDFYIRAVTTSARFGNEMMDRLDEAKQRSNQ